MHEYSIVNMEPPLPKLFACSTVSFTLVIHALIITDVTHFIIKLIHTEMVSC